MARLDRNEAIILGVLSQLPRPTLRTKVVKLIYLLDNTFFENMGKQATGFTYHWDHYGPNALGHAITDSLSYMAGLGYVRQTEHLTPYENYVNYYAVSDSVDPAKLPLSPEDWVFIMSIVKKFGGMRREEVVRASKQTAPMLNAKQYETLHFRQNERIEQLRESFHSDAAFVQETEEALVGTENRVSLEEFKDKVAEQPMV